MRKLKCFLGFHKWAYRFYDYDIGKYIERTCEHCKREQAHVSLL